MPLYWNPFSLSLVYVSAFVSPKKKKNFKKVLLGLFDLIQSIQYTLALFGPYWSYCVHFGLIQSPSILFGPLLIPFCPLWFNSVHFSPIRSKLVLFDPVYPLQSYLVHFVHLGLIQSIRSYSVLFSSLRSYSVHLISIWSYSVHLVHFVPFGPFDQFDPFWTTLIYFCALTK